MSHTFLKLGCLLLHKVHPVGPPHADRSPSPPPFSPPTPSMLGTMLHPDPDLELKVC